MNDDLPLPEPHAKQAVATSITPREAPTKQPAQKRPQNCGTGYCSCIECVMEPAQRPWVGLTDDEFEDIELGCRSTPFGKIEAMQKVEAKLKEKNA